MISENCFNDVKEWKDFFLQLEQELHDTNIILCGDFNSVTHSSDHVSLKLDDTSDQLNMLVRTYNLIEPVSFDQFTYISTSICT